MNTEVLNRQINRIRDAKLAEMGKVTDSIDLTTDKAMFYVGYLAAMDKISILINTIPED